jgi:hypothetical protein
MCKTHMTVPYHQNSRRDDDSLPSYYRDRTEFALSPL